MVYMGYDDNEISTTSRYAKIYVKDEKGKFHVMYSLVCVFWTEGVRGASKGGYRPSRTCDNSNIHDDDIDDEEW